MGAYTSSSDQNSEETNSVHRPGRPQGQKSPKKEAKGGRKGKGAMPAIHLSEETSELMREGEERKRNTLETHFWIQ